MLIFHRDLVSGRTLDKRPRARRRLATRFLPRLLALEERTLLSVLTVTNTNDGGMGSLRAEVAASQSGDTIVFSPKVYGKTITLTSGPIEDTGKDLTIQGRGASLVTVSGNNQSGIFDLQPTDASQPPFTVGISGLTLANAAGPDTSPSYAINDTNASLTLDGDVIASNQSGGVSVTNAYNIYPPIYVININIADSAFLNNQSDQPGAAVSDVGAVLDVSDSQFEGNSIQTGAAVGGALWMVGSYYTGTSSTIDSSLFIGNSSADGGGAIENWGGPLTINSSTFIDNQSFEGGAVENLPVSALYGGIPPLSPFQANDSTFIDNRAVGVSDEFGGGEGGAINLLNINAPTSISGCTFVGNVAQGGAGGSGYGGEAYGGAIDASGSPIPVTISGSTFLGNQAIGGSGDSSGGPARGGAILVEGTNATVTGDQFIDNSAVGGSGGSGSLYPFYGYWAQSALGGAIELSATEASVTGCAFVGNSAIGGNGGPGQIAGSGEGGAVDNYFTLTPLTLSSSTFVDNLAQGGNGGAAAAGSSAAGGAGGTAAGGAFGNADFFAYGGVTVSLTDVTITGNRAIGGAGGAGDGPGSGGDGGVAYGGAVLNAGGLAVASSLFTGNQAVGGAGGQGGATGDGGDGGDGDGGAILSYTFGTLIPAELTVTTSTFIDNSAIGGSGGMGTTDGSDGQGLGGAIAILDGTATITRSNFAGNKASTSGDDIYGTYT